MRYEVRVIASPDTPAAGSKQRTPAVVAREIRAFYQQAARVGGRVIAGHTLSDPSALTRPSVGGVGSEHLYLVAELPDTK
jgi:hypothetical protein